MATNAMRFSKKRIRRQKPKLIVLQGGKELGAEESAEWLMRISDRFRSSRPAMTSRYQRVETLPIHRRSVERAMLAVEDAFVRAMWVIHRTEVSVGALGYARTSQDYSYDEIDLYAQAVANGGWQTPAPRPALPSSKEITAADNAHLWVRFLEPMQARVLTVGAMSKRGDAGRKIAWSRVRSRLPELGHYTMRHLQGIYTSALRDIVARLTAEQVRSAHG